MGVPALGAAQSANLRASVDPQSAQRAFHRAPTFIENKGQWDSRARFLARTRGADVWVTNDGYVIDYYRKVGKGKKSSYDAHAVTMTFEGANGAKVGGLDPTSTRTDFFNPGKAPVQGARSYTSVYGKALYPGVDVHSYVSDGNARWDLIVSPKANPSAISFRLDGAKNLRIDGRDLVYRTSLGERRQGGLFAYQLVGGKRKPIAVAFERRGENRVGFRLGAYDRSKQLVIDPVLFGSYFGGERGDDEVHAVTSDKDGAVYMTGITRSPVFPAINGDHGLLGAQDFFLTRFQGDAYNIDYNAYVGGTGEDWGDYIQLSPNKTALWIAGYSTSPALPGDSGGNVDPDGRPYPYFLMRFPLDPVTVVKAPTTRYFGKFTDNFQRPYTLEDFAVSPILGNVVIAGMADQTVPGFGKSHPKPGKIFAYVAVYSPSFTPRYITYIGGKSDAANIQLGARQGLAGPGGGLGVNDIALSTEVAETRIALTGSVGVSQVNFMPLAEGDTSVLPVKAGPAGSYTGYNLLRGTGTVEAPTQTPVISDAFVATYFFREQIATTGRVPDATGMKNVFTGLVGGSLNDYGADVAVGSDGAVYMTGATTSFDYPRTRGVYGGDDRTNQIVVTKFAADGSSILYSTHLRTGSGTVIPYDRADLQPRGIAVDNRGVAAISGIATSYTGAPVMGTQDALVATYTPSDQGIRTTDGFVQILDSTATNLVFGSFIGTANNDIVYTPHAAPGNDFWIYGWTDSYLRNLSNANGTAGILPGIGNDGDATPWKPRPDLPVHAADASWDQLETVDNGLPGSPIAVTTRHRRDGFVYRVRVLAPAIASVRVFSLNNPTSSKVPGGFSARGRVVVTLTSAAPAGGASVLVTLPDDAPAHFANGNKSTVVFIPEGQTQNPETATDDEDLTTYIFTEQVTAQKRVDVRASYDGAFKVGPFNVVPWLQRVVALPDNIAGGNLLPVRVILAEPLFKQDPDDFDPNRVDTGPITVDISPAKPSDPIEGGRVTVAAPAQEALTNLNTKGVASNIDVTLNVQTVEGGGLVGAKLQEIITVRPATLTAVKVTPTQTTDLIGQKAGVSKPKVTFTLVLDGATPEEGFAFNLKASSAAVKFVGTKNAQGQYVVVVQPASAVGQPFQKSFDLTIGAVSTVTDVVLTATRAGDAAQTKSTVLRVIPIAIGSVTLNTSVTSTGTNAYSIYGGYSTTGTVKLASNAPASGARVYVRVVAPTVDDAKYMKVVDESVYFEPGTGTAGKPFRLMTSQVLTQKVFKVQLSRDANFTTGVKTITLTIIPNTIEKFVVTPNHVPGGTSATAKVVLTKNSGPGGTVVYFKSSDSAAEPDSQVTVPAGSRSAKITIATNPTVINTPVEITASLNPSFGSLRKQATLVVEGVRIINVTVDPTQVVGGNQVTGIVTIERPAPAGGVRIYLRSSKTAASVPGSIMIAEGETTRTFTINTSAVSTKTYLSINAMTYSDGSKGSNAGTTLLVLPASIASLSLSPNSIQGGGTVTGTITLNGKVATSTVVSVTADNTGLFSTSLPLTVTIPAGSSTGTFTLKTNTVARDLGTSVRATLNGVSVSANLTVTR